jgi:choloylglycine hydrolase
MMELHDGGACHAHSRVRFFRNRQKKLERYVMCTGIRLIAKTGAVVAARTMEFPINYDSDLLMGPRGHTRTGTTPDGVNEKGLAVGIFYFAHYAGYMPYTPADAPNTIAPWQVASWILDQFATVAEVLENIGRIVVPDVVLQQWKLVPPFHYIVYDPSGDCAVLEYVAGKLNVHKNLLGVITNSPTFDWHMTNLNNFLFYSTSNLGPVTVGPIVLKPFADGAGMFGLPGDITPTSRFVRAVTYTQSVWQSDNGADAVLQAFHILNNFDIPRGSARSHLPEGVLSDYTLWTGTKDLETKNYYFRTHENSQIRVVELMKMNLDANAPVRIPMDGKEVIEAVTPLSDNQGEQAA